MKAKLFVLAAGMMLLSLAGKAQELKIGYVQVEILFANMPETKQADTQLKEYETQLQTRLQAKYQDFQKKAETYQQTVNTMDAVTRQDTETELQNLQTQIQQFEANAQQSIAEKQQTLLAPLQKKLKETIDQVAEENGYSHVFSLGTSLVYVKDQSSDISNLVAQKLGFTLPQ